MRSTFGALSNARARQRSCRWPWERLEPDSETGERRFRNGFLLSAVMAFAFVEFAISVAVPLGIEMVVSPLSVGSKIVVAVMLLGFVVAAFDGLTLLDLVNSRGFGAVLAVGVLSSGVFVVGEVAAPMRWTSRRAVKISSSVNRPKGSRLLRIVPVNRVGSWTMLACHSRLSNILSTLTLRYHDNILPQVL